MKFSCFYFPIISLIFFNILNIHNVCSKEDTRIAEFQNLIKKQGPSISLNIDQYRDLVLKGKRNFNVVFVITAESGKICHHCKDVLDMFHRLAQEYYLRGKMNSSNEKHPTFFVYIDVTVHRELIDMHELTSVPVIGFISPTHMFKRKSRIPTVPFPKDVLLTQFKKGMTLREASLDFINEKAGEPDITIRNTRFEIFIFTLLLLFGTSTIFILGYYLVLLLRQYPFLMAAGAVVIQTLATSGLCWSVIHGFQWTGYDHQTRSTIWVSPNRRFQYAAEVVVSGLSFLVAGYVMKHNSCKIRTLSCLVALCLTMFGCLLQSLILQVNSEKQGFPEASFYPPSHYVRGPLYNDRGNSL